MFPVVIFMTITTHATCTSNRVFIFLAHIDKTFLMKLTQHNLTSTEQRQLGVFLPVDTSAIRNIVRDPDDPVFNTFCILEAWLDSRKTDANSTALFEELSEACMNIKRADLVNFVRCGEYTTVTAVQCCRQLQ